MMLSLLCHLNSMFCGSFVLNMFLLKRALISGRSSRKRSIDRCLNVETNSFKYTMGSRIVWKLRFRLFWFPVLSVFLAICSFFEILSAIVQCLQHFGVQTSHFPWFGVLVCIYCWLFCSSGLVLLFLVRTPRGRRGVLSFFHVYVIFEASISFHVLHCFLARRCIFCAFCCVS